MNYKIEKKEAFRIVGISEPLETEIEKNFEIVRQMWGKAAVNGIIPRLAAMMEEVPLGLLGVSSCNELDDWLIIEKIEDVVVGTSIPYNYDKSKF